MSATFTKLLRGGRLKGALTVAFLAAATVGAVSELSAQTSKEKYAERRLNSPFNLQAGPFGLLDANLVTCGISNEGEVCSNVFDSPTGGGGYWPSGTTNQYIFNSGLQIAGINSAQAGPWANDTVGAYFFDARGTQAHGVSLSQVYNSLDPNDLAAWPEAALIRDTTLFSRQLISNECLAGDLSKCAKSISDQDSYVEYWDGDPNRISQRAHPMGIKVQQRSLAFNAPAGAENTLFFIYTFTNVTNSPAFQAANEAAFKVSLPDAGWTINNVYSAFSMDPDVSTDAGSNYSTAILPFNIGIAYYYTFTPPDFNYAIRSDLYGPPFFQGSGFVGVKFLRSPIDPATGRQVGLTMFTNTTNPGSANSLFPDPLGVRQLFRYLKGDVNPAAGDPPCPIANAQERHLCAVLQAQTDTRFTQASGPFSLRAGESQTIVVAYTHGPPVAVAGYTPGTNLPPGTPSQTPGVGADPILTVEKIAGLVAVPPAAVTTTEEGESVIDETKVTVVPKSLLSNALVAQTIFNNKFLLPRPPEPPLFTAVPGDNQVTIIWQPSLSETTGDPYFAVASQATINGAPNTLFDPNYRRFDVEGYRIYRAAGLSGAFELIGEFDKTGTVFRDVTGALDPSFVPEEGDPYTAHDVVLNGAIIQYPAGGRIRDAVSGAVIVTSADTVILHDTGVPFVFVDHNVRNGITYRYQVVAFDVNSLRSGPQVLESARQTQNVVPRSSGMTGTDAVSSVQLRGATKALNPAAPYPTIDPAKGTFSGPQPPTNGLTAGDLQLALGQAVKQGLVNVVRIDSVVPYSYGARYYLTVGTGNKILVDPGEILTVRSGSSADTTGTRAFDTQLIIESIVTIPADTAVISGQFQTTPIFAGSVPFQLKLGPPAFHSGQADWAANALTGSVFFAPTPPASAAAGGSRWFDGANETAADPTLDRLSHGTMAGVEIGQFMAYATAIGAIGRRFHQSTMSITRAADVQVKWTNGQVTSVTDITHDVAVPFKAVPQAGYGFIGDFDGNGTINFNDVKKIKITDGFGGFLVPPLSDLLPQPAIAPTDGKNQDGAADGSGFALYINGEVYFFVGAPPANATWTLRTYYGVVRKGATYSFSPVTTRMPAIPGLTLVLNVESAAVLSVSNDLSNVHTVPDPYYVRSQFELGPANKGLRFVNLPSESVVRIYTINGTLVRILEHQDIQGGGELQWDLRNRNNQFVASGVYFYVAESPNGTKKTGRFTVVQFAR